jgi:uncharacterized protein (TIGR03067 family)
MMKAFAFVALAATLACPAPSRADDGKKDAEQIRGQWAAVGTLDADGKVKEIPEDDPRYFTFEFGADKLAVKRKKQTIEGTYKLDPSRNPKEIDVVRKLRGEDALFKGIYALEGDRLKFCLAGTGNDRPKEFKPGEGIEFAVVLKRVKGTGGKDKPR